MKTINISLKRELIFLHTLLAMCSEAKQYVRIFTFPYSSTQNKYEKLKIVQNGKFGYREVFEAREKCNPEKFVTMKQIVMQEEGFPIATLREIQILQKLNHDNITRMIEVHKMDTSLYLVYEFCDYDLGKLLGNLKVVINLAEIKNMLHSILTGLHYIHQNKILHRYMKPQNILVSKSGVIKISGFTYSRTFGDVFNRDSDRIANLWYRAPEILLGDTNYGPAIDLWAVGCIMAEMWARLPILQGNSERHQLSLISQICGSMIPQVWPGVQHLEFYERIKLSKIQERKVRQCFGPFLADAHASDLLDRLLVLDPLQRINAAAALNHTFFQTAILEVHRVNNKSQPHICGSS
ncbi:cyclin-dependent kinase 9-like [Leptinotarsa decemlineata]|uniref:cyclin-dependent kinase 9-like n=1 Tax=Leptinotarsa decemlineata TaxID=7539 RepID=UPI003D30BC8E